MRRRRPSSMSGPTSLSTRRRRRTAAGRPAPCRSGRPCWCRPSRPLSTDSGLPTAPRGASRAGGAATRPGRRRRSAPGSPWHRPASRSGRDLRHRHRPRAHAAPAPGQPVEVARLPAQSMDADHDHQIRMVAAGGPSPTRRCVAWRRLAPGTGDLQKVELGSICATSLASHRSVNRAG